MPTNSILIRAGHIGRLIRATLPTMHPGGRPIVTGLVSTALASRQGLRALGMPRLGRAASTLGLAAAAGSALFFRVPSRVSPSGDGIVVAPADGLISQITTASPPPEAGLGDTPRTRVSIFLSLLDVHVQFAPVRGTVSAAHYHPGLFLSADLDKASDDNERNTLVIAPHGGYDDILVTQIAGLLARRIVCEAAAGTRLNTGDVYGLIRFGSRVDTYLPGDADVAVDVGQRAVGGETVLTRLGGPR